MRASRVALLAAGVALAYTGISWAILHWQDHGQQTALAIGPNLTELKDAGAVANELFGASVSVSGNTLVVGAPVGASHAGRAYVFTKTRAGWEQAAELKGSDSAPSDGFGIPVAVSGTTVVVGAPFRDSSAGRAYVFRKTRAGWEQAAELKGSGTIAGAEFGLSVAVSGKTMVVGSPACHTSPYAGGASSAGRAYVFTRTATGWEQAAELKGRDIVRGGSFGDSVAVSGTTIVVGGRGAQSPSAPGAAFVFTKTPTGWKEAAELKGPGTALDDFGGSVAISGSTLVASASNGTYIFTETARGWRQTGALTVPGTITNGQFYSVGAATISGSTLVAAVTGSTPGGAQAYVFVFTKTHTGWHKVATLREPGAVAKCCAGFFSIAASGRTVVAGAPGEASAAGRAYVFGPAIGLVRFDPPTKIVLPRLAAGCVYQDHGFMVSCSSSGGP